MKRSLSGLFAFLILVVCAALVAPASAAGSNAVLVTGAGFTANSGFVVVNARATGPTTGSSAGAAGFLTAFGSQFGDLAGTVTCMASLNEVATNAVVSGVLNRPFVQGGYTYPDFSLLVVQGSDGSPQWMTLFPDDLTYLPECGLSLFFAAGVPDLPADTVVGGNFILR